MNIISFVKSRKKEIIETAKRVEFAPYYVALYEDGTVHAVQISHTPLCNHIAVGKPTDEEEWNYLLENMEDIANQPAFG